MKFNDLEQYDIESLTNLKIAKNVRAEFFVTSNQDILRDRKQLEKHFKIKIRSPEEVSHGRN